MEDIEKEMDKQFARPILKQYGNFRKLFETISKSETKQNLFKLSQEIDEKLRNGEDLNLNEVTEQNETILHALCTFRCHFDLLKRVSLKIDIHSKTKSGETAAGNPGVLVRMSL